MKKWFVIYTKPHSERVAAKQLEQQGFNIYLPSYQRQRRHARKLEIVKAVLFPRYLFVEIETEKVRWASIDATRGVSYLLRINNAPASITEEIIQRLKSQEDASGLIKSDALLLFVKGQEVQIIEGCFNGYSAIFEKMTDNERVQLLLNFLNKTISISLPIDSIQGK